MDISTAIECCFELRRNGQFLGLALDELERQINLSTEFDDELKLELLSNVSAFLAANCRTRPAIEQAIFLLLQQHPAFTAAWAQVVSDLMLGDCYQKSSPK
jgi:hypothetical protein